MPVHVEFPVADCRGQLSMTELVRMSHAFRSRRPAVTVGSVRGPFAGRVAEMFVRGDQLIARFAEMPAEYRRRFLPGKFAMELRLDGPAITNIVFAPADARRCTGTGCIGRADSVRRFSDGAGNKVKRFSFTTRRPIRKFSGGGYETPPVGGELVNDNEDALVERHYLMNEDQYERLGISLATWMAGWKLAKQRGMTGTEYTSGGGADRVGEEFTEALRPRTFAERQAQAVAAGVEAGRVHDHYVAFSDDYQRLGSLTPAQAVAEFLRLRAMDPLFSAREYLAGKTPRLTRV